MSKIHKLLNATLSDLNQKRAVEIAQYITPHLETASTKKPKILDIGCGGGYITHHLNSLKYNVLPIDISDTAVFPDVKVLVYDGSVIPFKEKSFDIALLTTVLHHIPDPLIVLKEAMRVSKRVIITEDIYSNSFQKYLTFFFDSLANLEFIGHPHSNKTDSEWKATFKKMGLKVVYSRQHRHAVFEHGVYVLEQ